MAEVMQGMGYQPPLMQARCSFADMHAAATLVTAIVKMMPCEMCAMQARTARSANNGVRRQGSG
jgi:hypothetical protein